MSTPNDPNNPDNQQGNKSGPSKEAIAAFKEALAALSAEERAVCNSANRRLLSVRMTMNGDPLTEPLNGALRAVDHVMVPFRLMEKMTGKGSTYSNGEAIWWCAEYLNTLSSAQLRWLALLEAGRLMFSHHYRVRAVDDSVASASEYALTAWIEEAFPVKGGRVALPPGVLPVPATIKNFSLEQLVMANRTAAATGQYQAPPFSAFSPAPNPSAPSNASTQVQMQALKSQWLRQYQASRSGPGNHAFSGEFDVHVEAGVIPWEKILEAQMQNQLRVEVNGFRNNSIARRFYGNADIPAFRFTATPDAVVFVDSSGSNVEAIGRCIGEVMRIAEVMGLESLTLVYVTAAIHDPIRIARRDFRRTQLYMPNGTGGTDMRAAFYWMAKREDELAKLPYSFRLLLTDGETAYPTLQEMVDAGCDPRLFTWGMCNRGPYTIQHYGNPPAGKIIDIIQA